MFIENARKSYLLAVKQSNVQDFFTLYIVRPIASIIAALSKQIGISPNILTIIGLIIHLISLSFIINGLYIYAGILIFITYIFDCSDGQLARLNNEVTDFGIYFDLIADYIKESTLYLVLIYISDELGISSLLFSTSFFVIMSSFFADWVHKSTKKQETDNKNTSKISRVKNRLKIQYWNVGIRNLVYILAIGSNNIIYISYYVLLIGSILTLQKYLRIFYYLKSNNK